MKPDLVRPAVKTTVVDDIVSLITSLIKSQRLKPGDKLPTEQEMVAMFHVSRSSVREAVRFLEARNVLVSRQGKGIFVAENPGFIETGLGLEYLPISQESFEYHDHVVETRLVIEVQTAGLAAKRRRPEEVDSLFQAVDQLAESVFGKGMPNMEAEIRFHVGIAAATQNPILARTVESLMSVNENARRLTFAIPGALERAVEEHRKIAEAIQRQDSEGARHWMKEHLTYVLKAPHEYYK